MGGDSWRICSLFPSQVAPSLVVCHPPLLSFPYTQSFGQELPTSLRQIFTRSPKAISPRFPLDLYPLPMFQIIYKRRYLFDVLVDSFGNSKEPTFFIHWRYLFHLGYFCQSTLGFPSEGCRGAGALWHCNRKKTSMMQLCCQLRVTNTQWQTIRKGGESSMVSLTNCYDLWVPLASRMHCTCSVYLRSVAAWICGFPLEKTTQKTPGLVHSKYVNVCFFILIPYV